nr:PREDICTED: protein LYRIC [Notothenia coriiceps]
MGHSRNRGSFITCSGPLPCLSPENRDIKTVSEEFPEISDNIHLDAVHKLQAHSVEFLKNAPPPAPITLCDSPVTAVEYFHFLGTIIAEDLKWEHNICSLIKKAQQRMFFLRQLKKFNLPKTMMGNFYTSIMESILTSSITIWYAAATAKDKGRLQRVISSSERVIGCNLPSLHHLQDPAAGREDTWSSIDGRIKTDPNPVNFSMLGLNTTDSTSNSMELQWARCPSVDDEWSGFNGIAAADPSSDWSAPAEHWGNYEQPPVMETQAPPLKEQPAPNKVSEDEKDADDVAGGAAKSKKSKKKKKKSEEEAASGAKMVSTFPLVNTPKPQEPPVLTSKKQNPSISSSQKKAEQTAEPPKGSQKKKV